MEFLGLSAEQWMDLAVSLGIVVVAAVVARWLLGLILERSFRLLGAAGVAFEQTVIRALRFPINLAAFLIALNIAVSRLDFIDPSVMTSLEDAFFVLYLFTATAFTWQLVVGVGVWYGLEIAPKTETDFDEQLLPFARRLSLILIVVIALIILLDHFDVNVSALVATLGVGSLAIALAAQESLSDTISGFIIMLDRPYRIGDRIEIRDLATWGDVVDIGLRSTRIRTRDNRMVIVPNSTMGKSLVVNHSFPDTQYRIQVEVGVAYGSDLEHARRTIVEAVRGVEGVLMDKPVEALFLHFGDSGLIFRLRWWIESYVDTRQVFDRVNTAVYNALGAAGITIPFPQQDVHHKIDPVDAGQIAAVIRGVQSIGGGG